MVPSNTTRGNRHKLKHRKFHVDMRKNFLILKVSGHWMRLSREMAESPLVDIIKTCLDMVLCNLLSQEGGPDELRGLFQWRPTCGSVFFRNLALSG